MRIKSQFSRFIATCSSPLLIAANFAPATALVNNASEHPVSWHLVEPSSFPNGLPEDFEPMEVPEELLSDSWESITERPDTAHPEELQPSPMFHICNPVGHAENPHVSGSDVSAHGSWQRNDCNNFHANVRVDLAAFWGNRKNGVGTWITVSSNTASVEPGTGRGYRVTARAHCFQTDRPVSWRNTVDVDVIDEPDWLGAQENIQTLPCAPQ